MNVPDDICQGAENFPICVKGHEEKYQMKSFEYVCCNIPGPGLDTAIFEDAILGCSCENICTSECNCVMLSNSWAYNELGQLNQKYFGSHSGVIFECNSSCTCPYQCSNKVVQKGIQYRLEVFTDPKKGFCLRTLDPILSNMFVCEYAGEVLSSYEAKYRFQQQSKDDMNYIFVLREHFGEKTEVTVVDPKLKGNVGRFLNHSCEPNLRMVPVRVHIMVPKLCLFAIRDICAGEELTYDYSSGESAEVGESGINSLAEVQIRKVCHCGSRHCRGFLPYDSNALK